MKISDDDKRPNQIVMNTIISAAAAGMVTTGFN